MLRQQTLRCWLIGLVELLYLSLPQAFGRHQLSIFQETSIDVLLASAHFLFSLDPLIYLYIVQKFVQLCLILVQNVSSLLHPLPLMLLIVTTVTNVLHRRCLIDSQM